MRTNFLFFVGVVLLLCVCTLVAFGEGGNAPNSVKTVDNLAASRMIEGTAGSMAEPEDYRFVVTTYFVKVREGENPWATRIGRTSMPSSMGTENVRIHLDTLAKMYPDCQVVVTGIWDLR